MIKYATQPINPINIASITDMGYLEAYRRELLTNSNYKIVRAESQYTNDKGETKESTFVFRVPLDADIKEFAKQYTGNYPTETKTYFLEQGHLLAFDIEEGAEGKHLTAYKKDGEFDWMVTSFSDKDNDTILESALKSFRELLVFRNNKNKNNEENQESI